MQPHLLVEAGDLHDIALLPGDPGRVDRIAGRCEDSAVITENREYKVVNATYGDSELTVCSTGIGSPSAAIAVEELAAVGVDTFLRVGTAGALQPGIEVGDVVVVTGAAKDEGTTRRYENVEYPAVPDYDVLSALVDAAERRGLARAAGTAGDGARGVPASDASGGSSEGSSDGVPASDASEGSSERGSDGGAAGRIHVGPVATDDAFYAETEAYVADWEAAGILAVEMEAAAIFTLARRKGLRAGAICTVDGNLVEGTQKGIDTEDEELPAEAMDSVGRMIDVALDAATGL